MNTPDPILLRMIDANANRAREALRAMEDFARFGLNDRAISAALKSIRHELAAALAHPGIVDAIMFRDTPHDVGTAIKTPAELTRTSLAEVVIAAGKRLSESLRVLEECAKAIDPPTAGALEGLRYRGYSVEQALTRFAGGEPLRARFARIRLYILLTDSLCHASAGGWEKMLDAILGGGRFGDEMCVQLREKNLSDAELLRRAKILAQKCHAAGALSIINDRPDIALLAGADGVHLGQTDLPCAEVFKLAGQNLIVGVSTEHLEQARQAVTDGATYIAVGPMFPTTTKEKPRLAGPAYAAEALQQIPVPIVPIGGITLDNLPQLTALKIQRAAVCSAIISAPDPAAAARAFLENLRAPQAP